MRRGVWVAPPDNLQAAQQESDYFNECSTAWDVDPGGPADHAGRRGRPLPRRRDRVVPLRLPRQLQHRRPERVQAEAGGRFPAPQPDHRPCPGRPAQGQAGGVPQRLLRRPSRRRPDPARRLGADGSSTAGASAFIGSLWEINDALAAQFAQAFYNRLWGLDGSRARRNRWARPSTRRAWSSKTPIRPTRPGWRTCSTAIRTGR